MTTKTDIDEALRLYGDLPRHQVPKRYRDPQNEDDFNISLALILSKEPNQGPTYDEAGILTGWYGIRLKTPEEMARARLH